MPLARRQATALSIFALLFATVLAFLPGVSGGFLFDDFSNIVKQEKVHASSVSLDSLAKAATAYPAFPGRPVATISFAIDYAVWGGSPLGFKLTGLAVHALNALLVFLLCRRLLALAGVSGTESSRDMAAWTIALLWAIHPLQVSTVLYVVQRMETLSLFFVLLALLCYVIGRQRQQKGVRAWPWLLACLPLLAAGLLSKESAVLFPAFALALELTLLKFEAASRRTALAWRLAFATGCLAATIAFVAFVWPHYSRPEIYAAREYDALGRVLTQLRVLPMYLEWILVPRADGYHFYYDNYIASTGLLQPATTLAGGALLLALCTAALLLRRRMPLFSLGVLWFFGAHLITSNVVDLELVFEHRNYFALLGILLAVFDLLRRIPLKMDATSTAIISSALLLGVGALTLVRSSTWGDPLNLAMALTASNPGSARASADLGEQYMILARNDAASPYYTAAIAEFERGSRVPNSSPMPEQGLIVMAASAGQPAKAEWWDRVVHKLQTRAIGPQELSMITGMLKMRDEGLEFDDGRFADAYLVLANRMALPPTQYYAFGLHALNHLGDEALAIELFKRAVDRSAEYPGLPYGMADALRKQGHARAADAIVKHARDTGLGDITLAPAELDESVTN